MRNIVVFVFSGVFGVFVMGCSDASPSQKEDAGNATDANAKDAATKDANALTDANAITDAPPASDSAPSEGACAACTANDCLNELQACGASQPCVNDLVTFNDCLGASSGDCGTQFAAGGSDQATLWACLSTKCSSTCGTE